MKPASLEFFRAATVLLATLAGSIWLPATTLSQGVTMERRDNTFVEGEGYDTLWGISYAVCASQCLADSGCGMIEFYLPENKCNLFRHTRPAGWSRDAVVGIKRVVTTPPPAPPPTGTMRRLTDSYVVGEGYDTILRSHVSDCEDYCLQDRQCRMMEYFRPEKKCNLYSHRNTRPAEGNAALVGVKE